MSTGLTPNYSLSYPLSTDPVNVAADIEDLAKDLDTFLTNPAFINNINVNLGSVITSATTANLFNTNATTLNIGQAATAISMGATTGTTTIRNPTIVSAAASLTLFNTASTTISFGGAATTFNIGASTGAATMNISNGATTNATTKTVNVGGSGVSGSTTNINIGSAVSGALGTTTINSATVSIPSAAISLGTVTSGTWNGTAIAANRGGTGLTSYAIGDIIFASGATALSRLADVATGNALISGGVGVAPSWGKIALTTHVSGTLPVANGGTGITSFGTGVATWLGTPSSANLLAAVTDETGSGSLVFSTSPSLTTPNLGSATAAYLTISAQDGVNEGGELRLNGAASNGLAVIDNYQGRLRFHNGTVTRFDITDTSALFSANSLTLSMNTSGSPTDNVSLKVERGTSSDVDIRWNETGDSWQFTNDGTNYFDIPTSAGGGAGLEAVLMFAGM